MTPPSTKDLLKIADSKYAVVVAVAKRARELSELKKNDENFRVSSMVSEALAEIYKCKIKVKPYRDKDEVNPEAADKEAVNG
ncbi:MAG TPA: DNA-directed RNA polymerase subunit omega [Syntrophomonas sp.]|jgi:DNA-directed RNA polymerase subunit omega|nr:DNA-directed RNA polymerase subunit omega [Syntrophomonas sp.]